MGNERNSKCFKITKTGKFRPITFIYHILLKLDRKLEITNKYATGRRSILEKLNFALQLKVPKKPSLVKKFYKLAKAGKSLKLGVIQHV